MTSRFKDNMLFSSIADFTKRKEADLLVFPFWEGDKKAVAAAPLGSFAAILKEPLEAKDFVGKEGDTLLIYPTKEEKRCMLLGLGKEEEVTIDRLRHSFAAMTRFCLKKTIEKVNIVTPIVKEKEVTQEGVLIGIVEGVLLSNYRWKITESTKKQSLLQSVTLVGVATSLLRSVERFETIAQGIYLTRDLINGNADDVTPRFLANVAEEASKKFPSIKVDIFDKKRIIKEKLGLLAAVGRGSSQETLMIVASYQGNARSKDHTVLVGKGITFDTGGLNLKPTGSMETMRDDMSGAATVLATLQTAAALGLKCNITAIVPTAENGIDALSFKPGDVYHAYNGKTVEIGNTDAEGRLILADALAYAVKNLKPTRIIDIATLTGSIVIALGEGIAGLMSNSDDLADKLMASGIITAEPLWRMPLFHPYRELLQSDIADIKNVGGRPAGSILAALFLHEFVDKIPWAHLDIAGTAFLNKEKGYWPKNGVGFGVRLLINFLSNL